MKITLYFIFISVLLTGCGKHMYSTMSSGQEDRSYIIVLKENSEYPGEISVQIDEQQPVAINKVYKLKFQRKAHPVYTTPGKHTLKVLHNGKVLFSENVFLGLQETKKIVLP